MRIRFCILLVLLAATAPSGAASRTETRAFADAAKAFQDHGWERAAREFADFMQKFPKSERRAEAVLLRAQALWHLRDYRATIPLLVAEQTTAGVWADQFALWLGEAHYASSNYPAAAEGFHTVVTNFPTSKFRLQASVSEAAAWAGLKNWSRVEELLGQPGGAFQQLAQAAPGSEVAARGLLLLAEARVAQAQFTAAEETLRRLDPRPLKPLLAWQREWLLTRALLGGGRAEPALHSASNLVALARAAAQPAREAQSFAWQAAALEELGRLEDAAAVHALNLTSNAPIELQRQALLKVGELALVRGRLAEAAQAMEQFLQRHPESAACDMALLTLGELQLKQYAAALAAGTTNAATTNLLQALASFDALGTRFPQSARLAKAQYHRGWCLGLAGRVAESAAAFAAAAEALPASFDQAVARFKLAEAQYQQQQFAAAVSNYNAVVALGSSLPAVRTNLCEPALYQAVLASIGAGDLAHANAAVSKVLEWFPESYVTEPVLLIAGQGLARLGDPAAARRVFEDLVKRFPNSERAAQVRLAIARTFELQRDWPGAVRQYQDWLAAFATNAERPRAEYALACATYQSGDETNALTQFTNFLALRATHALAPQAQWWVADYHFRHGEFVDAEKHYQLLFQTWPSAPLADEARMMAGRAAMGRQRWSDALDYFTNLTSKLDCSSNLWVQAMFAYGDAQRRLGSADTNHPLANIEQAARIFAKIHQQYPSNAAAARAWGEVGDCYLQLATRDARQYDAASNAFRVVVDAPWADVAARSQALVGLGLVAEKLAARETGEAQTRRLKEALDHYADVLYEKHVREGERSDAFWLKRAGLDAARLAEALQDWEQSLRICQRLQKLLPPLQATLDKRIEKAREHLPR